MADAPSHAADPPGAASWRLTGPRKQVMDAIRAASGPFTIEEIQNATPGVGRATVFRAIKSLHEMAALCRLQLEDGGIRYQLSTGEHHHHLICSYCGSVTEFSDAAIDILISRNANDAGFSLEGHSVELYGCCGTCRAANNARAAATRKV